MQKLLVYQSLWAMERRRPDGQEWTLDEKLNMIQRAGYPGVAADYDADVVAAVLPALEKRAREIQAQPLPAEPTPNLVPR